MAKDIFILFDNSGYKVLQYTTQQFMSEKYIFCHKRASVTIPKISLHAFILSPGIPYFLVVLRVT